MVEPILSPRTSPLPQGPRLATAIVFCFAFLAPAACLAQQRTRLVNQESPLSDVRYGPGALAMVISADGSTCAVVYRTGDGFEVMDGYPGFSYDGLAPGMPLLTPDGNHCAYVGRRHLLDGTPNRWFVVFDGAESVPFPYVNVDSPVFSPDGSRLAAVVEGADGKDVRVFMAPPPPPATAPAAGPATEPTDWWKTPLVPEKPHGDVPKLASEPGPLFDEIASGSLKFSPDGRHLAYSARRDRKWRVVVDGKDAGGAYDIVGVPKFCESGALLGYVGRRDGKSVAVTVPMGVAGAVAAEGRPHDSILEGSLAFSFDGRQVAYAAGRPGAMNIYLDGAEVVLAAPPPAGAAAMFEQVAAGSLRFSADGSRFAFAASRGEEWFVVVDGVEGPHYLGIDPTTLAFSLNGKRLAYVGEGLVRDGLTRTARFVVVDGVTQAVYDRIPAPPVFSPNGSRCAYVAQRGDQSFIVVDGMEGKPYVCLRGRPVLSIDGSRCAITAVADDPDHRFHAVEEVPRNPSDPSAGARLIFDQSREFPSLSGAKQAAPVKLLLVEERVAPE
jgi:hypothetical protein